VELNMYLIPFDQLFPEVGLKETRSLILIGLPGSRYDMYESYCPDPKCDCQRVMLNIVSRSEQIQVATISYGFDRSAKSAGPFLDVFNQQSPYAEKILAVIAEHLEADHAYVQRLKAHYALIKAAAADPSHPVQQQLAKWKDEEQTLLATDKNLAEIRKARAMLSELESAIPALERKNGQAAGKKPRHRSRGGKSKKI
jgi:hypothetical protein